MMMMMMMTLMVKLENIHSHSVACCTQNQCQRDGIANKFLLLDIIYCGKIGKTGRSYLKTTKNSHFGFLGHFSPSFPLHSMSYVTCGRIKKIAKPYLSRQVL